MDASQLDIALKKGLFETIPQLTAFGGNLEKTLRREDTLRVPSPTGLEERDVFLWLDDGELSVGFGQWHTHSTCWYPDSTNEEDTNPLAPFFALLEAIFDDRFLLSEDIGGPYPGHHSVLDLRPFDGHEEALMDALTDPSTPPESLKVTSWSGAVDGVFGLDDL